MNTEFLTRSAEGVGFAGVVLLTPFMLNHLEHGRVLLGIGTLFIIITLGVMAWLAHRDRYLPWLALAALTPAVLVFLVVSFYTQGVIGALWCFPAVLVFYFTLPEREAWVANGALLVVTIPAAWVVLEAPIAVRMAATLGGVSAFSAIFVRLIRNQQRALEQRAVTDALTGLHNRALLPTTLRQAQEQSRRTGTAMTLLALDLDGFKQINDTRGHAAGDAVLCGVAEILKARIRRSDMAFRIGGEEFLVFLYGTDPGQAGHVAEELRTAVEGKRLLDDRPVTVSIGVASCVDGEDWEAWLKRSDGKLYDAKEGGRNRVVA